MPRLPTGLAPSARQLLGLRPGLGPPLLTRRGRIARRRFRTRARVLPRLLFQPPQPLLEALHPPREIEHDPHAHIPTRVIDRLSLGTIHTPKIRRKQPRTLLWRPTTERLRFSYARGMSAASCLGLP